MLDNSLPTFQQIMLHPSTDKFKSSAPLKMVAANSSETSVIPNNHGDIPHNTVIFIDNVVSI
jgi:hypothetical protein